MEDIFGEYEYEEKNEFKKETYLAYYSIKVYIILYN